MGWQDNSLSLDIHIYQPPSRLRTPSKVWFGIGYPHGGGRPNWKFLYDFGTSVRHSSGRHLGGRPFLIKGVL